MATRSLKAVVRAVLADRPDPVGAAIRHARTTHTWVEVAEAISEATGEPVSATALRQRYRAAPAPRGRYVSRRTELPGQSIAAAARDLRVSETALRNRIRDSDEAGTVTVPWGNRTVTRVTDLNVFAPTERQERTPEPQ